MPCEHAPGPLPTLTDTNISVVCSVLAAINRTTKPMWAATGTWTRTTCFRPTMTTVVVVGRRRRSTRATRTTTATRRRRRTPSYRRRRPRWPAAASDRNSTISTIRTTITTTSTGTDTVTITISSSNSNTITTTICSTSSRNEKCTKWSPPLTITNYVIPGN